MGQLPEGTIDLIQDEYDVETYELDQNKKIAICYTNNTFC